MADVTSWDRWALWVVVLGAIAACAPSAVEAQTVTVQGQVQYGQTYGQPPPGYGQPYAQPYAQPYYGQPQYQPYAPTYQPQVRQVRYVEQETSIKALWIPGIIVFGVSWVLTGTIATSLTYGGAYTDYSWIPLAGPWLMLGEANDDDELAGALISGIAQLAGAAMFVLGLALRQTVRVAVYSLDESDERAPQLALELAPAPAGGMVGLALSHF